jgi:hypothetical protein
MTQGSSDRTSGFYSLKFLAPFARLISQGTNQLSCPIMQIGIFFVGLGLGFKLLRQPFAKSPVPLFDWTHTFTWAATRGWHGSSKITSSAGTPPVPSQVGHFTILNTDIFKAYYFYPCGDCAVLLTFKSPAEESTYREL